MIPFALEVRCLVDHVASYTALDMFQFFQLYQYHYDCWANKIANRYYYEKVLGTPTELFDKCLLGWSFLSVVLFLLIAPFMLFSDWSMFLSENPVIDGEVQFAIIFTKAVFTDPVTKLQDPSTTVEEAIAYVDDYNNEWDEEEQVAYVTFEDYTYMIYQYTDPSFSTLNEDQYDYYEFGD